MTEPLGPNEAPTASVDRAVRGAMLLSGRHVLTTVASAVSAVFLSRWLAVEDVGLFSFLQFVVLGASALVVGDLGLNLALVRAPDEPSPALWTAAERVVRVLAGLGLAAAGVTAGILLLSGHTERGAQVVVLAFALAARFLRSIPSARLSRDQRFRTMASCELLEAAVYFSLVLVLAAAGAGLWALVLAITAKEVVGSTLLRISAPRMPGAEPATIAELRPLLSVGSRYQLTGLLTGSTDAFQPMVIGSLLGATTLGHVSWAYSLILMPVLFLASVDRAILPVLASVQRSASALLAWTTAAMRLSAMVAIPAATVLAVCAPQLIAVVFDERWLPSVRLIRWFAPAIVAVSIFNPVLVAYNALGRTGVALRLAAAWAVLTWTLGLVVVARWGTSGYGWFYVALQTTYLPIAIRARRDLGVTLRGVAPALVAGLASLAVGVVLPADRTLAMLSLRVASMLAAFAVTLVALARQQSIADARRVWSALRHPR